eukprot:scaffold209409_cov26-Tisochrysis_lutea.AAC.2
MTHLQLRDLLLALNARGSARHHLLSDDVQLLLTEGGAECVCVCVCVRARARERERWRPLAVHGAWSAHAQARWPQGTHTHLGDRLLGSRTGFGSERGLERALALSERVLHRACLETHLALCRGARSCLVSGTTERALGDETLSQPSGLTPERCVKLLEAGDCGVPRDGGRLTLSLRLPLVCNARLAHGGSRERLTHIFPRRVLVL